MAQEGNHSMEGSHPPSNSGQQPNVVDDFLAALFASNPPAHGSKPQQQQQQQEKEKQEPPQQQQPAQQPPQQQKPNQQKQQQVSQKPQQRAQGSPSGTSFLPAITKKSASPRPEGSTRLQNKRRDRDIDEFEEYEMLSKRKQKPAPKRRGNGGGSGHSRTGAGQARTASLSSFNGTAAATTAAAASTSAAPDVATNGHGHGHAPALNPNHPRNRQGGTFGRAPIVPNARLHINGLPHAVKKTAVIDHFSQFGPVGDVFLKNSYGFVQFERPESCLAALHGGRYFEGVVLDLSTTEFPRNNDGAYPTHRDEQVFIQGAPGYHHPHPQDTGRSNRGAHRGRPYDRAGGDRGGHRKGSRFTNDNEPAWSSEPQPKYQANRGRGGGHLGPGARGPGRGGAFSHQIPYNGYQRHQPQDPRLVHVSPASRHQHQEFRSRPFEYHPKSEPSPPMSKGYYGSHDVPTSYDRGMRGRASVRGGRGGASRGRANDYHSPPMSSQEASHQSQPILSATSYPSQLQSRSSPQAWAESDKKDKVPSSTSSSSSSSKVPLPRRHGQAVPIVQIVAWDDAEPTFIDYIEDAFRSLSIRVHALNLKHGQVSQDEIVKHLVKEGVMALVTVSPGMEVEQCVTLQVFQPDEQAGPGSFHFDEYEQIQVEDCTAVVEQLCETQKVNQDQIMVEKPSYEDSSGSLATSLHASTTTNQATSSASPLTTPPSAPMLASAYQVPSVSPVVGAQNPVAPPVAAIGQSAPAPPLNQPSVSSALPAVLSAVQGLDLYSLDQSTLSSLIAAAQGLVNSQFQATTMPPITTTQSLPATIPAPMPTPVQVQQPNLQAQPPVPQMPIEQPQPQSQQQQQQQQQTSSDPTALLGNPMIQQLLASMNLSSAPAGAALAAPLAQEAVPQYNPQTPALFPSATQIANPTSSAPNCEGVQTQVNDLLAQLRSTLTAQASVPQSQ